MNARAAPRFARWNPSAYFLPQRRHGAMLSKVLSPEIALESIASGFFANLSASAS